MSAETLISLQKLIIKQNAHTLNETRKQSLQRHVQKFVNVTQIFLVKNVLQQNQIRFLIIINDEVKVRRSIKSMILEKTKVMSYENLVAKRAERKTKEQDKVRKKRKRNQKRKSQKEADASE